MRTAFLTVTVLLHPQRELPEIGCSTLGIPPTRGAQKERAHLLETYGASETDIAKIHAFAAEFDLIVLETNKGARSVKLAGSVLKIESAFHVDLYDYEFAHGDYRGRTGGIFLPIAIQAIVSEVLGLDDHLIERT